MRWPSFLCCALALALLAPAPTAAQEDQEGSASTEAVASDGVFPPVADETISEEEAAEEAAERGGTAPKEGRDVAVGDDLTGRGIEEITVTAQKREQSLQDVPAAVSAFSGNDLDESGVTQMQDLAFQVPNVHYGQEEGAARITIRGVSTGVGSDQSTAFHIDGVYQNDPRVATALTFYDLQRVEVLRGPQGTLYGRNATGGAINVISAPPTFDFDLFGDVQIGTYNEVLARGVVNVPLVEDMISLRVSAFFDGRDGYQKNAYLPGPIDDADDADDLGVRAQLLYQPLDDLDITLRFNYFSKGGVGYATKQLGPIPANLDLFPGLPPFPIFAGASPNPADVRRTDLDTTGAVASDSYFGNLDIQYAMGDLRFFGETQLKVLGSYRWASVFSQTDQDATDKDVVHSEVSDSGSEWTVEIDFTGQNQDWDWVFGLFHFGTEGSQAIRAPANVETPFFQMGQPLVITIDVAQYFDNQDLSVAAFGQVGYQITEDLRAEFGLRYSYDWKTSNRVSPKTDLVIPNPPPPGNSLVVPVFVAIDDPRSDSWGLPSGTLGLDYQLMEDHLLYGKFSTGYKSGAVVNDIPILAGPLLAGPDVFSPDNVDPEIIYALEFGLKTVFLDNRMRGNFTVFNYWYSNLQVSQLVESQNVIENAANAKTFGAEVELFYMPWDNFTLIASFSYLDATFAEFDDCISAEDPLNPGNCTGNQLPRAPEFTGSFIAQYDFDLERFGMLTPRIQVFASDKVYFRATNLEIDEQPAYALLNLRLMWRSEETNVSIEGFIDNVTDEDVATTKFVGSSLLGSPIFTAYDRPRTAGIRVGLSW